MEMTDFVNWHTLATYGGALTMVLVLTQATKDISFLRKIPTQILSYVLSFLVLIVANAFTNGLDLNVLAQTILNALLVSIGANGGFQALIRASGKTVDGELLIDTSDPEKDNYRFDVGDIDDLNKKIGKTITLSVKDLKELRLIP